MKFSSLLLLVLKLLHIFSAIESNISGATYGTDYGINGRIITGQRAIRGQFPWQAFIRFRDRWGNQMVCGGALITPNHVLTAAHCVYDTRLVEVVLGTTRPYDHFNPDRIAPALARAVYNSGYNKSDLSNDVAVIEFKTAVKFTPTIQPIRLAKPDEYLPENVNVTVSGWGQIVDRQTTVNDLYFTDLITMSNEDCRPIYGPLVREYTVCCRGNYKKSICNGDSGGPLVKYDNTGTATHVGIVSFAPARGCELSIPTGFIRTSSVLSWIEKATNMSFN